MAMKNMNVTSLLTAIWTKATHEHDPHVAPAFCWGCHEEDQDMTQHTDRFPNGHSYKKTAISPWIYSILKENLLVLDQGAYSSSFLLSLTKVLRQWLPPSIKKLKGFTFILWQISPDRNPSNIETDLCVGWYLHLLLSLIYSVILKKPV